MNSRLPRLPLDLSTFREMRKENYLYIDKTEHAYNLITAGRRYFLSRPRRFGKSVFVSTLREILIGNRDLFDGLWIEKSNYTWPEYGVVALDFSRFGADSVEIFKMRLCEALALIAKDYQLTLSIDNLSPESALEKLVLALYDKFGRVALVIDEYDSPILQLLKNIEEAEKVRDAMRRFFTAIKGFDECIKFVFITGVSSFAKAGLFSGMNNLQIITLEDKYATICGYTDKEIDDNFSLYLHDWAQKQQISFDDLRSEIKRWYNGYHFGIHVSAVYNPFSFMHALSKKVFKNFWFTSGTPTFLIEELKKQYRQSEYKIINPEGFIASEDDLGIFDVGKVPLPALMFQAGYLTIESYDETHQEFKLVYPNVEVKTSLQRYLLAIFARLDNESRASDIASELRRAFDAQDIDEVVILFKQLFAHVPYQLHTPAEKFYHALLQIACSVAGIKAISEFSTSHGRIDLVVDRPQVVFVIEVKFNASAQEALQQIQERRYYERFMHADKPIILLGLSFERAANHFDIKYASKQLISG